MSTLTATLLWVTTFVLTTTVLHLFSPDQPTRQRAEAQLGGCVIAGICAATIMLILT